ncbi:MAG: serine/threonine protein kinase [Planctomycetota bacterium]|nr:MAG: serine/threonine protein kinase [Planctomycetota bacterium]
MLTKHVPSPLLPTLTSTRPSMSITSRPNAAPPRAAHAASQPHVPSQLGSWELVDRIGGGALSEVYSARPVDGRRDEQPCYALKVLRDAWQDDPRGLAMLGREVLVARDVAHPHLVPILAAELEDPPYYLMMPRLEGVSLAAVLAGDVLLDLPMTFWLLRQTAEATTALARAGWMHGDIKPSNVIVSPSGHATLVDLGFAARSPQRSSICCRPLLGTINYMAPEMLYSSYGGDVQSDVYSLGVMLFEMLAGRLPFDAQDVAELALQHRQQLPGDVRTLAPRVPLRAARLVKQMLAKEPLRRPAPEELVERLIALEIETFAERCLDEAA